MPAHDLLSGPAADFEAHRTHLRAVAYRMLGSLAEADDAVQETWLRLARADTAGVTNLGGWLTRVVGRVCLDVLRSRRSRHDREAREGATVPAAGPADPEAEALLADEVGLALLVVLDRLGPAERVAFVLHDLFAVPFADIGPIVGRSAATTKRLASRARQRVRGGAGAGDPMSRQPPTSQQRELVEAWLAATRRGDLPALLELLAPDVVRRADLAAVAPGVPTVLRGARAVAEETRGNAARAAFARAALVGGAVGAVVAPAGRLVVALRVTVDGSGRIGAIDVVADPTRLATLELGALPD
jgi:RNA polymerase sigma factor (sigma-70 family)